MIIATAGHVDHGKTSLIRQLTGVETDTLAEERERGLSINLGYAYLPRRGGNPLGFIDVPGHQRFINTMISGISGIDMGLLVVAADDGPMPQTIEHLDVLDILGVNHLTVAISKIDRADVLRIDEVEEQIRNLLVARRWQDTVFFRVSNQDGSGVAALKDYLLHRAQWPREHCTEGGFRLSIDRCFTARGAGLVVTGTASAGRVCTGDKLLLLPSGREASVRGLRTHDQTAQSAGAGERVALNLAGKIAAYDIEKGDWLVDPGFARCSSRLDVTFSLAAGAPFPLKHLAPVKLYIGARRIAGRLAIVDGARARLHPGDRCLAQLILDKPVSAIWGERFLLRDQAEDIVLGGGSVLDPEGPKFGKSRPGRLTWLRAMQAPTAKDSLAMLLDHNQVVNLEYFWAIRNRSVDSSDDALPQDARYFGSEGQQWLVKKSLWSEANQHLARLVGDCHQAHPEQPGIKMTDLKPAMSSRFEPALVTAVLVSNLQAGTLVLRDGHIRQKEFKKVETAEKQVHWLALKEYLERCQLQVPPLSEVAEATRIPECDLKQLIKEATRAGQLHRLNDKRYALPEQLLEFSELLLEADRRGEALTVVKLKSHFQNGRNLTVELLEYFDSIHFTKRENDTRIILNGAAARDRFGG
ncbi:MAG: selenocysteine-specific translation elongation factor [Halioglobus sp.]|nr:selenocysteine-specific translation elongation factor [Halioglobus sp.]